MWRAAFLQGKESLAKLSDHFTEDTLEALPIRPTHVETLQGPVVRRIFQVRKFYAGLCDERCSAAS
jgi:hypothetical protein